MSELIIDKLSTRDGSMIGAIVVSDIDELLLLNTNKEINTTAIVKDSNRGGVFNYDGAQSGVNNGGTIFNGWVRQYDGGVYLKWFGLDNTGAINQRDEIQNIYNNVSTNVIIDKGEVYQYSSSAVNLSFLGIGQAVDENGDKSKYLVKASYLRDYNDAVSDAPLGIDATDYKTKKLYCVLKKDAYNTDWYFSTGSTNTTLGFEDIELNGMALKVNYDFKARKVGNFVPHIDESLGALGINFGCSVNLDHFLMTIRQNLQGSINTETLGHTFPSAFQHDPAVTVTNDDGLLVITHNTKTNLQNIPTITSYNEGIVGTTDMRLMVYEHTLTTTKIASMSTLSGYIYYNGSAWAISTDAYSEPTLSESGGVLTVTLDDNNATVRPMLTRRQTGYDPRVGSVANDTFTVEFYNDVGTKITAPDTSMKFYFEVVNKSVRQKQVKGKCLISIPNVTVNPQYWGTAPNHNIWVSGEMDV